MVASSFSIGIIKFMAWEKQFKNRLEKILPLSAKDGKHIALSIKVHPESGCYHREHSPDAYIFITSREDFVKEVEKIEKVIRLILFSTPVGLAKADGAFSGAGDR